MNPLSKHFRVGQKVKQNHLGFVPYDLCDAIVIEQLSISTVIVTLHYTKDGQQHTQPNVHIPYEHLVIENDIHPRLDGGRQQRSFNA